MPALHSLRFHDILHTLEDIGYSPEPSQIDSENAAYYLSEQNPDVIIDTLRLTQNFKVEGIGHFSNLRFSNGEIIAVDADYHGTRIMEVSA